MPPRIPFPFTLSFALSFTPSFALSLALPLILYLAEEIAGGNKNRHYRLRNYLHRNCENYPTHELGPIAKLLNINRGNRMLSMVSVASRAAGMEDYINQHAEE